MSLHNKLKRSCMAKGGIAKRPHYDPETAGQDESDRRDERIYSKQHQNDNVIDDVHHHKSLSLNEEHKLSEGSRDHLKRTAKANLARKMPRPKLQGLAHGGEVAETTVRPDKGFGKIIMTGEDDKMGDGGEVSDHEKEMKKYMDQNPIDPAKYSKGGKVDMYAMDPDVESMHGMDKGGEDDGMDELMDASAGELMDAIERKDKKGILESIRALVLNCGDK